MKIERKNGIPVYRQISEDIHQRITQGEYPSGGMLPPESRLCSIYSVERATVRRALALLVDAGLVSKIPGLGTMVLSPERKEERKPQNTVLFLLPKGKDNADMTNEPFNAKLINVLDHECVEYGFSLLYKSLSQTDTAEGLIRLCNPCGVFIKSAMHEELCAELTRRGVPVVLLNQTHGEYASISMDNRQGARMVVDHLFSLGHRKIGYIGAPIDHQTALARLEGYQEVLSQNGIVICEQWIAVADWTMDSGKDAMRQILSTGDTPTAVFCANDAMAIGAMNAIMDAGLSVPGDISVAGFDNIDQSSCIMPTLTTVAVDYQIMARVAYMLLADMIRRGSCDMKAGVYTPIQLIIRQSTAAVNPSAGV